MWKPNNRTIKYWIGILQIAISWGIYGFIFIVPFLSLHLNVKLIICTGLYVVSYMVFLRGVSILGKEFLHRYRKINLLSWFKRRCRKENKLNE